MRRIVLIIHDVRSAHNVGSLLRTADGLGIEEVIMTGYSPYPVSPADQRLPHEAAKTGRAIAKTALGAEKNVRWQHSDLDSALNGLSEEGYLIAALEQASGSVDITKFNPPQKLALIIGNEITGLEKDVLAKCELSLEIKMLGEKESFNVAAAAAMALFYLRIA